MAPNVKKTVLAYAGIAFILLGVLFGMNIMTFIFGSLSPGTAIEDVTLSVTNQSQNTGNLIWINATTFTIPEASFDNFSGSFAITDLWVSNDTGYTYNLSVSSTYYTINAALGTITNATITTYTNASVSYTLHEHTDAYMAAQTIQNDTLNSIQTYSNASGTQFSTISIAIILVILISLFLLFWTYFMGGSGPGRNKEGSSSFS